MSVKYFLGISIIACLLSCSDLNRPDQLERLAEGQAVLDSVGRILSEVNDDELFEAKIAADGVKAKIDALDLDTIDYAFAVQLDRFNRMGEGSAEVLELTKILKEDVSLEKDALKKLSSDIELGSGKREMYDTYIQFELDKIEVLRTRLDKCMVKMTDVLDVYDELEVVLRERLNERFLPEEVH